MGASMNKHRHMIFTMQNKALENAAVFVVFGLFPGSDGGLNGPRCVIKAPLRGER